MFVALVKDDREMLITEEREVMEYFRKGFKDYYTTAQEEVSWKPPRFDQRHVHLSDAAKQSLDAMISTEEIKEALWPMKPYKAPSLDGLHVSFFQRFWLIVGDSMREEVEEFSLKGKFRSTSTKRILFSSRRSEDRKLLGTIDLLIFAT